MTLSPDAPPSSCDVLIAGAGVAGTAAAVAYKRLAPGASVVLVDAGSRERPLHDEVLPETARPILKRLGCWDDFAACHPDPTGGTRSAGSGAELEHRSVLERRGWRVDKQAFVELLADAARRLGVTLVRPARLVDADALPEGRGWSSELEARGRAFRLSCRFAVDATGRQAHLARRLGAKKVRFDRLVGAFAFSDHRAEAARELSWDVLIEARREGFWYLAPRRSTEKVVAAFMTDADLAREIGLGNEAAWRALLADSAVAAQAGEIDGPPSIRALDSHRLDHVTGRRWLAVGDAACTGDVLVASGLVQALDSGARAGAAIVDDLAGRRTGLHRYQRITEQSFEELLRHRGSLYALEERFAAAPFWIRRRDHVTLDPDQMVSFYETTLNRSRVDALGMHLPGEQMQRLCSLCVAPRLAQAVVSAFRQHYAAPGGAAPSEERVFLALQYLVDQGLVSAE